MFMVCSEMQCSTHALVFVFRIHCGPDTHQGGQLQVDSPIFQVLSETRKWVYASGGYLRSPKTGEIAPCKGKPCLISSFELSGHQFGTILKSFILTFQSASIQPSPVEYCLSRMQETLFQAAKTPGMCFSGKKSPRQGCTTQKTELGMHQNQSRVGMLKFDSNLFQIDLGLAWVRFAKIIRQFG